MDDTETFLRLGAFVRSRREAHGLNVTQLAAAAGLSKSEISGIEGGRIKLPGADKRRRLARALGCRHVDLLIAAGELAADEVEGGATPPSVGAALAEQISRLSGEDRRLIEQVLGRILGDTTRFSRLAGQALEESALAAPS